MTGLLPAGSRAVTGGALWLLFVLLTRPGPFDPAWVHALLLLAPLALLPLGIELVARSDGRTTGGGTGPARCLHLAGALQLPAAGLLAVSYLLRQGPVAAGLALPWLAVAGLIALAGLLRLRERGLCPVTELALDAGLVYLVVGAAWAVSDRLGFRPLGFPAVIVLLTAVHFHYAGFILPVVTGLAARRTGGRAASLAALGVVAGVPLVAVGITATQLGLGPWIEAIAAWTVAGAGALVAWLHLRLAVRPVYPGLARALWTVAALSLAASMGLAALYGSRFHLPQVRRLDIAWMQALHGAANTFGFAAAGLLGWWLAPRRAPETILGEMSRRAQARGLTRETPDEILRTDHRDRRRIDRPRRIEP